MDPIQKITRTELYDRVWTTPMHKLAAEFGLSDVGLAKLCRRHEIPVPGRGYWARLQFGQSPKRVALLEPTKPALDAIQIIPHRKRLVETYKPREEQRIPTIEVAGDGVITHRLALRIERSVSKNKSDERGLLLARKGRTLPILVALESLPRALQILDALLTALDAAGYKIEWPSPYNVPLIVIVLDEKLRFSITEFVERQEHKPTKDETARQKADYWWRPPKWDYTLTGRLKVTLESTESSSIRHSCADGKRRRVETCLGEILVVCENIANAVKKERQERAEAERKRAEERKREEEERQRQYEYDRKAEVVGKLASSWRESRLLREFAAAMQADSESGQVPDEQKQELRQIADWTVQHADFVDPLTDFAWVIRQFKKPEWQYDF